MLKSHTDRSNHEAPCIQIKPEPLEHYSIPLVCRWVVERIFLLPCRIGDAGRLACLSAREHERGRQVAFFNQCVSHEQRIQWVMI